MLGLRIKVRVIQGKASVSLQEINMDTTVCTCDRACVARLLQF